MTHRANASRIAFGILLALGLGGASPGAAAPREGPPIRVEVSSLEELRQALGKATPGSVIRLTAGTYQILADDLYFPIKNVEGLPDQPIVIQGTRAASRARPTIIDGGRRLDQTLSFVERFRSPGGRTNELEDLITQNQFRTRAAVNCLVFEQAAYVVIEDLTVRDCWPTSFVFLSSRYVTLRAMTIVGSTYAYFVDRQSDHFLVEDSVWTQDDSGYAPDESGYSGRVDLTPKPGRMWDTIPWGVAHHGSRAYLNGGLIGSFGAPGSIIVRHNVIRNTYNGVRIRANRCELPPCNVNVEIYDNDFQFVRDNPVEPEDQATNWWIFHNRIYNAHGWFSFDGVGGGPIYLFGNVGWFDDKPSRRCIQRDWAGDQTLQAEGYAPTSENECSRSRTGKVVKLGPGPIELKEPIYTFNNSWYVRAPVVDGGTTKFRAWNNASLVCEPNVAAPGMCVAEFNTEKSCVQSMPDGTTPYANRYPVDVDRVPFVDCFAMSPEDESSNNISNHPDFPDKLIESGYPIGSGLHGDPGFINAAAGDFRLRPDSLARGKGCLVARAQDGSLTCGTPGTTVAVDVGAYQGDALVEAPDYLYRGDEQPRVMKTAWRTNGGAPLLEIAFSTAIQDPANGTRMAVRLDAGAIIRSEPCQRVRAIALDCRFPALRALPPTTATLLVPRSVKSLGGKPVTLWAARTSHVEFQR